MVVKPRTSSFRTARRFESRVILDGSQTTAERMIASRQFESRVILDGSQTLPRQPASEARFESRVILDGSQTGGTAQ